MGWAPPWRIHGGSPLPMGDSPRRFPNHTHKGHLNVAAKFDWGRRGVEALILSPRGPPNPKGTPSDHTTTRDINGGTGLQCGAHLESTQVVCFLPYPHPESPWEMQWALAGIQVVISQSMQLFV